MNRAFIFPGQGSQIVGMGKDFYDNFPRAREVFQEIDDTLKFSLSKIIFNGPEEDLTLTENTQSALMAVSIAILVIIKDQSDNINHLCSYVAGHSLGEYSALCAANSLTLQDTSLLLRLRGRSMQEAAPYGVGAMAACLGIDLGELKQLIHKEKGEYICQIANDNIPGQIVISGHDKVVDAVVDKVKQLGFKAIKLKVSAPFHSDLIKPAEDIMRKALERVEINKPAVPIIANVNAKITSDPIEIKQNLVKQICGRVRWRDSLELLCKLKVKEVVEIGAGKVLTNMIKKAGYPLIVKNVSNIQELEEFMSK